MRFLKIKVIINGKIIYPLEKGKPVVVPLSANYPQVVVTDGFHFTGPVQITYKKANVFYLKVGCVIEDDQLIFGLILLGIFYAAGLTSDLLVLKLMSFLPVVMFLYFYYGKRKAFLNLKPA